MDVFPWLLPFDRKERWWIFTLTLDDPIPKIFHSLASLRRLVTSSLSLIPYIFIRNIDRPILNFLPQFLLVHYVQCIQPILCFALQRHELIFLKLDQSAFLTIAHKRLRILFRFNTIFIADDTANATYLLELFLRQILCFIHC